MGKSDIKADSDAGASRNAKSLQGALEHAFEKPPRRSTAKSTVGGSVGENDLHNTSHADPEAEGRSSDRGEKFGAANTAERSSNPQTAAPPNIGLTITFGSLVANLLGLATPLVILQVYDRIIPNQAVGTFTLLILGLICALCLEAILRTSRAWLIGWSSVGYEIAVARANMEGLLGMPSKVVAAEPESEFLSRLSAIDTLRQFYGGQSRLILIDLPFVCLFLGLIWTIAGPLVFVPVFLFGAFGALTVRHGASLRGLLERRNVHDAGRQDFSIHTLSDLSAIKSQVGEAFFHRRHDRHSRTGSIINYETVVLGAEAHSLSAVFSNVAIVTVVSFGAYNVISGALSIGALAAVTLLTGRAMQPLVRALGLWSQIQSLHIAKSRVSELNKLREHVARGAAVSEEKLGGEAILQDVKVGAHGSDDVVLDIPKFAFQHCNLTVVRCLDGVGARELAELLAGEAVPLSGSVNYRTDQIGQASAIGVRDQIAFVSDPPTYFDGTILHNISMFQTGPALDRALDAAHLLGLDTYVDQLPEGYETDVMSGVVTQLPAGLVQLMVLARAVARQPQVLILLDPLSRLDRRSQRNILNALNKLKNEMTIIAFSHHSAFDRLGDCVLDLKDGRLRKARLAKKQSVGMPSVALRHPGQVANG